MLPASAATRTEKAFGKWAVICEQPDNEGKSCSMVQSHVQAGQNARDRRLVLRWAISINKNKELTQALVTPTGVSIKEGVRLFIDDATPSVIEYSFCGPRVCIANAPIDAKLAASIKASKKASANYVRGSKKLQQVELSLDGFAQAYDFMMQQLS
jgi:invasion protein IalB